MTGFVYAIAAGDLVKIGWSADPRRRFVKIASDNGVQCELLGYVPASREQEAELHSLFSDAHVRGEWFRRTAAVEQFIDELPHRGDEPRPDRDRVMGPMEFIRRRVLRISQVAMADLCGVTQATVSRWENGEMHPHLNHLAAIRAVAIVGGGAWDDAWFFEVPTSVSSKGAA